jgi:hypothetical protein
MGKVTINSKIEAAVAINSMQPIGSGSAETIIKKRVKIQITILKSQIIMNITPNVQPYCCICRL